MISTVGLIELNSIAKGIETADTMVKAAQVQLLFSKPACPGKFIILVAGDVGAVKTSVQAGLQCAGRFAVNHLVVSSVHPQLIPAINGTREVQRRDALGVMEFFSIASAITSADAAAKAAQIELMEIRLGMGIGGKSFVTLCGSVSAVQAAVEAGLEDAREKGHVISSCVIPSPSEELFYQLL
ncbi:MAG TPA: BMC domain-containing protein [Clostridiales bacterium]|nr:BMC domain-containing protein [Clostridiales bacterium]